MQLKCVYGQKNLALVKKCEKNVDVYSKKYNKMGKHVDAWSKNQIQHLLSAVLSNSQWHKLLKNILSRPKCTICYRPDGT